MFKFDLRNVFDVDSKIITLVELISKFVNIIKNKTIITCNNNLLFGDIILFKSENKPSEKIKIIDIKKKLFSSNNTNKKTIIIKKPPVKGTFLFVVNF